MEIQITYSDWNSDTQSKLGHLQLQRLQVISALWEMKFNHRFVQLLIATNPHTERGWEKLALWRKQHLLQISTQPSFLELKHFSKSGVITLCLPRSSSSKRPWDINTTYICGYIPQLYKQGRCFLRPGAPITRIIISVTLTTWNSTAHLGFGGNPLSSLFSMTNLPPLSLKGNYSYVAGVL